MTLFLAHAIGPADFNELRYWWEFDPGVVIPLVVSAVLYAIGVMRLRRVNKHAIGAIEISCFIAGWLTLVIALVSPLHPWGAVLFAAHMTQHELLMLVAAPLLVLSRPMLVFLWAFPKSTAREMSRLTKANSWQRIWRAITAPFVAWVIHAVVLWAWHVPVLFNATIENNFVHALQHTSFLASALLFWWAVLHGRQRALGYGAAVLYMFTTALHTSLLGALLTFSRGSWYSVYTGTTQTWGVTPIEDQQLGGLIMWIPAGVVYIIAGLALFAGWLRESETRALRASAAVALVSLAFALSGCGPGDASRSWAGEVTGGDPIAGKAAILKYGCVSCHTIDGMPESQALVGPPLFRMAGRSYLAGNMQNTAANLTHFIQHPRQVHEDTAMPEMGVTDKDARDIAAYLYQFK